MNLCLSFAPLALALALSGCGEVVTEGAGGAAAGGSGGIGNSPTGGSFGGEGGLGVGGGGEGPCTGVCDPLDGTAIAVPEASFKTAGVTIAQAGAGAGGPLPDPLDQHLFVSSDALTCADPYAPNDCGTDASYLVSILLPYELQVPGTVKLDAPALGATFSETSPSEGGVCGGGGGSFVDGELVIVSVTADAIVGYFANTVALGDELNEKLFTAVFCSP